MIVPDANILLYAYDRTCAPHVRARHWVEQIFSQGELIGLPWQTVGAFLRVSMSHQLRGDRFTGDAAVAIVDKINGSRGLTSDCWFRVKAIGPF